LLAQNIFSSIYLLNTIRCCGYEQNNEIVKFRLLQYLKSKLQNPLQSATFQNVITELEKTSQVWKKINIEMDIKKLIDKIPEDTIILSLQVSCSQKHIYGAIFKSTPAKKPKKDESISDIIKCTKENFVIQEYYHLKDLISQYQQMTKSQAVDSVYPNEEFERVFTNIKNSMKNLVQPVLSTLENGKII